MPLFAGLLFAIGVAGLLLAVTATLPGAPFPALLAPAAAGVGLLGLGSSWLVLLWRNARLEEAVADAQVRVAASADDVRRARIAVGDAEHSVQAAALGTEMTPLLREWLEQVKASIGDADRLHAVVAALRGLAAAETPSPTGLHDLLDDAALRAEVFTGAALRIDKVIESAGVVAVDRERVVGLLVQVLAAAYETAAVAGRPIRVEVAEWQAGLLRLVVTVSAARGLVSGARLAGLQLAQAQARAMGGSLAWHDGTAGERRFLFLLPLEAEDAPTDPSGIQSALTTYYVVQWGIVGLGTLGWWRERVRA